MSESNCNKYIDDKVFETCRKYSENNNNGNTKQSDMTYWLTIPKVLFKRKVSTFIDY